MKKFFVGIKGVIVNDDKVLLIKSSGERAFWEVPGGRIDETETIEQTLTRELNEEVPGIANIEIGEILSAYRVPRDIKEDISLTLIFYKVAAAVPQAVILSDEHTEYRWVSQAEALGLVEESCKEAIARVF